MKTIISIVTALALLSLLLFFTTTTSAASVRIASISPDKAHSGKKETITVRITNDSDTAQGVKLAGSTPNGCSLKSLQPNAGFSGNCKATVPAKGFFDATFELSFSDPNSSGDITWTLKEDGWISQPVLDTRSQTIASKRNIDEVRKEVEAALKTNLKTGDGFRSFVETGGIANPKYALGVLVEPVAIYPGDASVWADGYNTITEIKANVCFGWHSNLSSQGYSQFVIPIAVEGTTGGKLTLKWTHGTRYRWEQVFDLPSIDEEKLYAIAAKLIHVLATGAAAAGS